MADGPGPKSATRRKTEETVEAVAAAVPFAGGVLAVKYAQAFRRADQRRFEQWQRQVEASLDAIASKADGIEIEKLFADDDFVSCARGRMPQHGERDRRSPARRPASRLVSGRVVGLDEGVPLNGKALRD